MALFLREAGPTKAPCLVFLHGLWLSSAMGQMLSAKVVMAPGVGHIWNLEAPDLFTETVRAWMTDQPLSQELFMYG